MLDDPRLPQRFWDKVVPEPNSGCWIWTAATDGWGYGRLVTKTKATAPSRTRRHGRAHRFAYERLIGPLPEPPLELDHKCRVRCCVNPAHLEPVTRIVNARRGIAGAVNGARQRAKTHCKRGHEFNDANTLTTARRRRCRVCRRKGVRDVAG